MLNKKSLQSILPVGSFGQEMYFHKRIGSTNDEALKHARKGAPHGTLVIADEQTEGRGRSGRMWSTPAGSAIALSIILRPEELTPHHIGELTVLGALATVEAFGHMGIQAWIKWPNDVLVSDGKVAGVLVEGGWMEDQLLYAVMGLGMNVSKSSLEGKERFDFPAACIEDEVGGQVDRLEVIKTVLEALADCYNQLGTGELISAWEDKLAYKGKTVTVQGKEINSTGKLVGITEHGQLRLQLITGEVLQIGVGGQQLRPVERM